MGKRNRGERGDRGHSKLKWHDKLMNGAVGSQIILLALTGAYGDGMHWAKWASMGCSACSLLYCAMEWRQSRSRLNAMLVGVAPLLVCACSGLIQSSGS